MVNHFILPAFNIRFNWGLIDFITALYRSLNAFASFTPIVSAINCLYLLNFSLAAKFYNVAAPLSDNIAPLVISELNFF